MLGRTRGKNEVNEVGSTLRLCFPDHLVPNLRRMSHSVFVAETGQNDDKIENPGDHERHRLKDVEKPLNDGTRDDLAREEGETRDVPTSV